MLNLLEIWAPVFLTRRREEHEGHEGQTVRQQYILKMFERKEMDSNMKNLHVQSKWHDTNHAVSSSCPSFLRVKNKIHRHAKKHLKTSAFTLIELLVVISIISLLISILLPALAAARKSAQSVQCAANQRQVFVAMTAYSQNHKDWIAPIVMKVDGNNRFWPVGLGMEILNMQVTEFSTNGVRPPGIFSCPGTQHLMDGGDKSDWGRSNWICRIYDGAGTDVEIRNADMIKPGKLLAIADSDNRELTFTNAPPDGIPSTFNLWGRHKGSLAADNPKNLINVTYFDGHVVNTAIKELPIDSSTNDHKRAPWQP